jgi:hypothetical protein
MGAVQLKPGVNTQQTEALNEAGISQSQLIRYKGGLVQTYGGWDQYVSFTAPSTVRNLHAWQDANGIKYLSAAGTMSLSVITANSLSDITPQTLKSDFTPNFSVSSGSVQVTIVDPNSGPSLFNTAYFNTPVAIGNLLLNGAYPIISVLSTGSYIINSSVAASTTIASSGILPGFNTVAGTATVTVTLPNNNFQAIPGEFQQFIAPTSISGLTIQGKYQINSVIDSTQFTITLTNQSTTTSSATMNAGLAEILYYVTIGPQAAGSGFGAGGFGLGGFGGVGGAGFPSTPGTPINAIDWTQDNWGEILLSCPEDGPIYSWSADAGTLNAQVVSQAPFFNGGIFISQPQQILVAWRSVQNSGAQNQLEVRWSDANDYTNWTVSNQTSAGSFVIPTGSRLVGGLQCPTFGLLSTDIDVWVMQYVGGDVIFNFTRVGTGCGWIGKHACGVLAGIPYWCGVNNFFTLGSSGVVPMPCSVWDAIFQNLSTANQSKVACGINSGFNEIAWFYPSATSPGENDSYVKVHIEGQEYEWDYGVLSRTAWIDISVLGQPIATDSQAFIYQHETGNTITGASLPFFRSGWWAISEGNELSFVDFVMPDFQWGDRSGAQDAQINVTFFSVDYPGDTPVSYGPYTVTQATEYITPRIRGRLMSIQIQAQNAEFWRLGKVRFRYAASGRR